MSNKFVVCCCSPEIPHGESMKFTILAKNQEVLQQRLFKKSDKTDIETVSPLPEYLRPPFIGKQIIGRHRDVQTFVQLLASTDIKHRLILVSGELGLGKSTLVKTASMYAFERRIFNDGVIYLNFRGRKDINSLYDSIAAELNIPGISAKELCRQIDKLNVLIILDKMSAMIDAKSEKLINKIRILMETTYCPKVVLISEQQVNIDMAYQYPVNGISEQDALRLFKELSGDMADQIDMHADEILPIIGRNPSRIENMAPLLKQKTIEGFKTEMQNTQDTHDDIRLSIENLRDQNEGAADILALLC